MYKVLGNFGAICTYWCFSFDLLMLPIHVCLQPCQNGAWEMITSNVLCVQQATHQLASVQSDKVKCDASCHMAFKDPPISLKFTRDPFSDGSVWDLAVLLLWAIASLGNDICNYKAVCMHWTTTLILMSLQCSHGVWILCEHHVDEQALARIMQPVRSFS